MDAVLHCNELKCRATCPDRAVVTTCSHVFCLPCAERLELTHPKDGQRKCPACSTLLLNHDDAVVASLNPTEDYKTSILSGFSPTVIMECASRGLSFWAYQMAQEILYHEFLGKSLADRYTGLAQHFEGHMREQGEEKRDLMGRLEGMHRENEDLVNRYNALQTKLRDTNRQLQTYREMHGKLKAQALPTNIESAIDHEVEQTLQQTQREAEEKQRPRDHRGPRSNNSGSNEGGGRGHHSNLHNAGYSHSQRYAPVPPNMPSRSGLESANSSALPSASQNRQPLPVPAFGAYNDSIYRGVPNTTIRGHTPLKGYAGFHAASPGLSANARASRTVGAPYLHLPRSRSGFTGGRTGYPVHQ